MEFLQHSIQFNWVRLIHNSSIRCPSAHGIESLSHSDFHLYTILWTLFDEQSSHTKKAHTNFVSSVFVLYHTILRPNSGWSLSVFVVQWCNMSRDQIDSDWIYRLTYITVCININNRILSKHCIDAISLTLYEKKETSNEVTSQFFHTLTRSCCLSMYYTIWMKWIGASKYAIAKQPAQILLFSYVEKQQILRKIEKETVVHSKPSMRLYL